MGQPEACAWRSGPGISEEEQERVFDPFYRVLGNEQKGSGLGLSIVRTIGQLIGASVTLAAAVNRERSAVTMTLAGQMGVEDGSRGFALV